MCVVLVNHCQGNQCMNGATCVNQPMTGDYACQCPVTYYGQHCECEYEYTALSNRISFGGCSLASVDKSLLQYFIDVCLKYVSLFLPKYMLTLTFGHCIKMFVKTIQNWQLTLHITHFTLKYFTVVNITFIYCIVAIVIVC